MMNGGESSIIDRLLRVERSEERLIVASIALLVPIFALVAVVAAVSTEGPRSTAQLVIAGSICVTTIPVGIAMTRLAPGSAWRRTPNSYRRPGAWFVLYANLGVAGVLFTFADHELAMYGTALFAIVGSYASHFLGGRAIVAHVCFASIVIIVLGVLTWRQGQHDVASVVARCLTSLIVASVGVILVYVSTAGVRLLLHRQFDEAARDPLTTLWNRRGFATHAKGILGLDRAVSFIVLDIDCFKRVNDRFGHEAGDEVLKLLAERLLRLAGPETFVARTGGEEFALAVQRDELGAMALADRIRTTLHDDTDEVPVSVSIGVSALAPDGHAHRRADPAQVLREALRTADVAMYEAKAAGGNRVVVKRVGELAFEPFPRDRPRDGQPPEAN